MKGGLCSLNCPWQPLEKHLAQLFAFNLGLGHGLSDGVCQQGAVVGQGGRSVVVSPLGIQNLQETSLLLPEVILHTIYDTSSLLTGGALPEVLSCPVASPTHVESMAHLKVLDDVEKCSDPVLVGCQAGLHTLQPPMERGWPAALWGGGQQQQVCISRVGVSQPRVVSGGLWDGT